MNRVTVNILSAVLVAMLALPACTRMMLWEDLSLKVEELNGKGVNQDMELLFANIEEAKKALEMAEKSFPPADARIVRSLNNLAEANMMVWNYPEVAALCARALAIIDQAPGADPWLQAKILINQGLANSLWFAGDRQLTGSSFRKALQILEQQPDPERVELADALYNLAVFTVIIESDFDRAEPLFRRAIEVKKKVLGPNNLGLADDMIVLAAEYRNRNRFVEADDLIQQAFAIQEKTYGPDDPRLADLLENVAGDYSYQKEYARAESYYEKALARREKNLGSDSLDLIPHLEKRADYYFAWGRLTEANAFCNRALEICVKAYGENDVKTGEYLERIADFFRYRSERENLRQREAGALAESYFRRALSIFELVYGPADIRVAAYLERVAYSYRQGNDFARAETMFRQALAIYEKTYGAVALPVAEYLRNVGYDLYYQKEYDRAAPLLEQAFAIRQKLIGVDSADLIPQLRELAGFYYYWQKFDKAESLYRRALTIGETVYGKDDQQIVASLEDIGSIYYAQKKYKEAEPYYRRGFEISEKKFGPESVDLVPYLDFMAGFYSYDMWDHERAEGLYRRLIAICERFPGNTDLQVVQARSLWRLILVLNVRGISSEDEAILKRALTVWERIPARENEYQEYAETVEWMAGFNLRQGNVEAAEEWYKKAVAAWEKVPEHENNFNFSLFLNSLAYFYKETGREEEGERLKQRAAEIDARINAKQE